MTLVNAWIFGSESALTLHEDAGFTFLGTVSGTTYYEPTNATIRTFPNNNATRYSMEIKVAGQGFYLPGKFMPDGLQQGAVAWSCRKTTNTWSGSQVVCAVFTQRYPSNFIEVRSIAASGALDLRVIGQYEATTPAYDWRDWHWLTVYFEAIASTTIKAKLDVDGVAAITEQTRVGSYTDNEWIGTRFLGEPGYYICEFATFDSYSTTVNVDYVSRLEFTDNGADSGTWSGVYTDTDSPISTAASQSNTNPSTGHYLAMDMGGAGGTDDINTQLGITPDNIRALVAHVYADGNATIDVRLSDDAFVSSDIGADKVLSNEIGYQILLSTTTPSGGGAWSGTDTPAIRIQVES